MSKHLLCVSRAGIVAAIIMSGGISLLTSSAEGQVLGGYGPRTNGPLNPSYAQPYTPSWAGPQPTPSWAGPQPTPSWAGPQPTPSWAGPQPTPSWATPQRPSWANPQNPSWAQMPSPSYSRPLSIITPAPVAPINSPSPPRVEYRRRVVTPSPENTSVAPPRGNIVQSSSGPVFGAPPASYRVTTPIGQRELPTRDYSNYVYNAPINYVGGPSLLGGYYYGNYCDVRYDTNCYPSVYGAYSGMPQFIYNPGVIIVSEPYYPVYSTSYLPFYAPVYQVTYNENNYYVASDDRVQQIQQGGVPAKEALKNAYPADSYQAAFADIQKAWLGNDPALIDRHLRDKETKLSVFVSGKYTYSLASGDFLQITRDAFDRLNTISFDFTRLRKAENGDVTAFGKHVYRASGAGGTATDDTTKIGDTVPFSTDGSQPYDKSSDPVTGAQKTIYVSYTLRQHDKNWYIIAVDSSPNDLVK